MSQQRKIGVTFVCLGNICRSPMAKGLFQAKLKQRGLTDRFEIDSSGTSSYHVGERPDPGSVRVAREAGIDLSRDRSTQVTRADLERFDYVIALDRSNRRSLLRMGPEFADKIHLMREFEPGGGDSGHDLDVPDPWGEGQRSFERAFRIIDGATDGLLDHIVDRHPELQSGRR